MQIEVPQPRNEKSYLFKTNLAPEAAFPQFFWIDQKREVVVFRRGHELIAYSSVCPHMGAQFQVTAEGELLCPWHGLSFNVDCAKAKSNHNVYRHLARYAVRLENGSLEISEWSNT